MFRRLFLLSIALFCLCCSSGHIPPRPIHYDTPAAIFAPFADTDFTPTERQWLQQAADNLAIQTRGLVRVKFAFVLDFNDSAALEQYGHFDRLVRIDPDSALVQLFDQSYNTSLLGLTRHYDPDESVHVYLVADRIIVFGAESEEGAERTFVSVAMHEFLHAVGLPHTTDMRSLMYPGASVNHAPTCLHRADVVELCRRYGCDIERIGYCSSQPDGR